MKKLKLLLEQRADKLKAFETLATLAEGRELTEDEVNQLSALEAEMKAIEKQIASHRRP
jgi:hypothetical protein